MGKVLEIPPREQSGGDSYNRFEYQVHCIAYKLIGLIDGTSDEIVFCEFHDDYAVSDSEYKETYDFYQVKTKDNGKEWTISEMSQRRKDSKGKYSSTFLGRMFLNFQNFGDECRRCYFISNAEFSEDIREWAAYVQNGQNLKEANKTLYAQLRDRIVPEFGNELPKDFDETFERFANKSIAIKADIALNNYEEKVKLSFLEKFAPYSIPINALTVVYESIVNDVRRKSKEKISTPISKSNLIRKKGICISHVRNSLSRQLQIGANIDNYANYLTCLHFDDSKIHFLSAEKRNVDVKMANVDNLPFIQAMAIVIKCILSSIPDAKASVDVSSIIDMCKSLLSVSEVGYVLIKDAEIEVKIYERMQSVGISLL